MSEIANNSYIDKSNWVPNELNKMEVDFNDLDNTHSDLEDLKSLFFSDVSEKKDNSTIKSNLLVLKSEINNDWNKQIIDKYNSINNPSDRLEYLLEFDATKIKEFNIKEAYISDFKKLWIEDRDSLDYYINMWILNWYIENLDQFINSLVSNDWVKILKYIIENYKMYFSGLEELNTSSKEKKYIYINNINDEELIDLQKKILKIFIKYDIQEKIENIY